MRSTTTPPAATMRHTDSAELQQEIKQVHRNYPTGVTIVTVRTAEGLPAGLAVNAFSSISLDPPHVMVAVNRSSSTYTSIEHSESIAINILASEQVDIVKKFAVSGGDKFAGVEWTAGKTGNPLLHGATGSFEMVIRERLNVGTHAVLIGEVLSAASHSAPAMIYRDGTFYSGTTLTQAS